MCHHTCGDMDSLKLDQSDRGGPNFQAQAMGHRNTVGCTNTGWTDTIHMWFDLSIVSSKKNQKASLTRQGFHQSNQLS